MGNKLLLICLVHVRVGVSVFSFFFRCCSFFFIFEAGLLLILCCIAHLRIMVNKLLTNKQTTNKSSICFGFQLTGELDLAMFSGI